MVPGSTLMYGSSLHIVTRKPRHLRSRPSEEAVRPFPSELETPPATKMTLLTPPSARQASRRVIGAPDHDNRTRPNARWTTAHVRRRAALERGHGQRRCRDVPRASGTA